MSDLKKQPHREPKVMCRHCETSFPLPERFEAGDGNRVQLQCPRKGCGEWSWFERHELGLGGGR